MYSLRDIPRSAYECHMMQLFVYVLSILFLLSYLLTYCRRWSSLLILPVAPVSQQSGVIHYHKQ
jgi:hypothetical protein